MNARSILTSLNRLPFLRIPPSRICLLPLLWLAAGRGTGQEFRVLYHLPGDPSGVYGGARSGLVGGADGYLYGTTFAGSNGTSGLVTTAKCA